MKKIILIFMGLSFFNLSCTVDGSTDADTEMVYSVESAVSSLSGVLDDQNNSSFAKNSSSKKQKYAHFILELLQPKAYALCGRAFSESCTSSQKSTVYSSCSVGALTLSGTVSLSFTDSSCLMNSTNDVVTRTYDYTISGPRGGALRLFSSAATDYRGNSISGGGRLTKTTTGWNVEVLGKNKTLTINSSIILNHSIKTLSPVSVTGSLARSSRVLDGGQIEVNHNLTSVTNVITPSNLTYSSGCCHPVSGSLSMSYSGSKSGTATVTYNSCGSATITDAGTTSELSMTYCE
jgi:hypothetical protein